MILIVPNQINITGLTRVFLLFFSNLLLISSTFIVMYICARENINRSILQRCIRPVYTCGFSGPLRLFHDQLGVGPNWKIYRKPIETDNFFLKVFGGHTCPFWGPLVPLFWISGDVSSGVQSQSGFCLIRFFCGGECNVHSPRSTSGATLANLLSPHTVAEVWLPGFELMLSEYL